VMRVLLITTILATAMLPAPSFAAVDVVNGVRVDSLREGYSRVVVTFTAKAPTDWQMSGEGSDVLILRFPNASASSPGNLGTLSGANAIASVQVTNGIGVTLRISLTSAVRAVAAVSGNDVISSLTNSEGQPSTQATPAAAEGPRVYEVVQLHFADVGEIAGLLVTGQQVLPVAPFQPTGSIFSLPTSGGAQTTAVNNMAATSAQTPLGQRLSDEVGIDRRLNVIVLSGTNAQIAAMKGLIARLDIPAQSVMLECKVVELSESGARDLGLSLAPSQGAPIATGGGTIGGPAPSLPQYTAAFQASLYATIQKGGGKVLASPSVLATDNIPAQILTGDALPIITTTVFPGGTAVTQSSVNYVAVGVNLQIQPHIDTGGFVTANIFAEVSSVTSYVATSQGQVPEISLRQISTSATVKDGQPFMVGGLFLNEEINSMSKIPILGDLPILGGLFRVRNDSSSKSNLYVVITPHIIRNNESPLPYSSQ
jgi:type II secretory pathway component GspD/PulD (secretin)